MLTSALPLIVSLCVQSTPEVESPPPSRALLLELAAEPRLAGTSGSLRGAKFVRGVLEDAGFTVEFDEREICLSLPRRLEFGAYADVLSEEPFAASIESFDPDAIPAGDIPRFSAWSAEGDVRGAAIDAGYGLRADFERLVDSGIDLAGTIALCRYGKGYRGVKVRLATQFGCAGVLLFSDPSDDGADKGEVWPAGPWKPGWDAQRGSILPIVFTPGDPSTPGFASPAPGQALPRGRTRLAGEALSAVLPTIPCLPIGADDAGAILERLAARRMTDADGTKRGRKVGPGPVEVRLSIVAPRELRTVRNVIARLAGSGPGEVILGAHRDSWVRGAHDAGGGCVSLLRAAQHLGQRARAGSAPENDIVIALWDAEEPGLLGSTEWGEAHADHLREHTIAYVNADAAVSGTRVALSGTPGLEAACARALARVPSPRRDAATLLEDWIGEREEPPRLGLPGSGSDFTVFLHHLTLPVLDVSFRGNSGGQYHTSFDDFALVERFLDPGFVGHESAGLLLAALAQELSASGPLALDDGYAAHELARHATLTQEWLGAERAAELAAALTALGDAIEGFWSGWLTARGVDPAQLPAGPGLEPARDALVRELGTTAGRLVGADPATRLAAQSSSLPARFYAALVLGDGLPDRPWYRNRLWTPGRELGYGSETFPGLRDAESLAERDTRYAALLVAVRELSDDWTERTKSP